MIWLLHFDMRVSFFCFGANELKIVAKYRKGSSCTFFCVAVVSFCVLT